MNLKWLKLKFNWNKSFLFRDIEKPFRYAVLLLMVLVVVVPTVVSLCKQDSQRDFGAYLIQDRHAASLTKGLCITGVGGENIDDLSADVNDQPEPEKTE